jgi:hypothetical protein
MTSLVVIPVTCFGCQKTITDLRFKCKECQNYNECSTCHATSSHNSSHDSQQSGTNSNKKHHFMKIDTKYTNSIVKEKIPVFLKEYLKSLMTNDDVINSKSSSQLENQAEEMLKLFKSRK